MALGINIVSEARVLTTRSGRPLYFLDDQSGFDLDALVAACHSAACRPPGSGGTGGSSPEGATGESSIESVARGGGLRRVSLDPNDSKALEMVGASLKRRIARDMADESGPMWYAVWMRKQKQKLSKDDEHYLALHDGDPEALKKLLTHKFDTSRFTPSTDQELLTAVDQAINDLKDNRPFVHAMQKFGEVPIVVAQDIGGLVDARYLTDAIIISEVTSRTIHRPMTELNTGTGIDGVIRHEYGHHIESIAPDALLQDFHKAHSEWPGRLGGPADLDRVLDAGEVNGHWPTHGVSMYARTNGREAFAEVFAMVTHPDFDRKVVSPEALPMVDAMLEIIK